MRPDSLRGSIPPKHRVSTAVPTTRRHHGGPAEVSVGGKVLREYSHATGTPIAATPQV